MKLKMVPKPDTAVNLKKLEVITEKASLTAAQKLLPPIAIWI